LKAEEHW